MKNRNDFQVLASGLASLKCTKQIVGAKKVKAGFEITFCVDDATGVDIARDIMSNSHKTLAIMYVMETKEFFDARKAPLTGVELIEVERKEQIEKHGRTIENDQRDNRGLQLVTGAIAILSEKFGTFPDGWDLKICNNIACKPYKERLAIAGALIAAEIDRVNYEEKL